MRTNDPDRADDYCDRHLLEVRNDPGEADPDGRIRKADKEYASLLIVEEILRTSAFISRVGFDPHAVLLSPTRTRTIVTALPEFAPFCCFLGHEGRERVLRKSRHPPIEFELERRSHVVPHHESVSAPSEVASGSGEDSDWANT